MSTRVIHEDNPIARAVRRLVEESGQTQEQVANRGGTTDAAISRIASGLRPDPHWSTLEKICRGCNTLPLKLVGYIYEEQLRGLAVTGTDATQPRVVSQNHIVYPKKSHIKLADKGGSLIAFPLALQAPAKGQGGTRAGRSLGKLPGRKTA